MAESTVWWVLAGVAVGAESFGALLAAGANASSHKAAVIAASRLAMACPVLRIVIASPRTRIAPEFAPPDRKGSPDLPRMSHRLSVLSLINGDIAHLKV